MYDSHLFLADYSPVREMLSPSDFEITFSLTTYSDDVVEGGEIIVLEYQHALIPDFVDLVEATGEFISHTAEVLIIDRESECAPGVKWSL